VPLFTRLLSSLKPHLLDTQYRMHPILSAFSNDACYAGRLLDGVHPRDRGLEDRILRGVGRAVGSETLTSALPFGVVHVAGKEKDEGSSKANDEEASAVAKCVGALLAGGLSGKDVAVLSPYSGQVRCIKRALRNAGIDPFEQGVEVASVDAIQGREKEVIVFSTCRANSEGRLGFVTDWRRLNVGLTRARRAALVFMDATTLVTDREIWRPFLSWALAAGVCNAACVTALRGETLVYDQVAMREKALVRTPSLALSYDPAPLDENPRPTELLNDAVFDQAFATEQANLAKSMSMASLASLQDSIKDAWDDSDSDDVAAPPPVKGDGGWGDDDDDATRTAL